ncbi:MAG: hypothetical protein ACP5U1_14220 [Desulfomonilaceae bacterium]
MTDEKTNNPSPEKPPIPEPPKGPGSNSPKVGTVYIEHGDTQAPPLPLPSEGRKK